MPIEAREFNIGLGHIHPFSENQSKALQLILSGFSNKEIGVAMFPDLKVEIAEDLVKNIIYGHGGEKTQGRLGIFGIVEQATGHRPQNRQDLINTLVGDVVFQNIS